MHLFKAFTVAVIVMWCQVKGSHSKSKHKSIDHEHNTQKKSSQFTDVFETSSISSHKTKTGKSVNNSLSDGTQNLVFEISSETTNNKISSDEIVSEEDSSEKSKLNTEATTEPNATELAPVFRPRMKHRQGRFRTNRPRHGNSTIRRQRYRKGFGPRWRTLDNGTRIRLNGKLRRGRTGNGTFRLRAQRFKKPRKRRITRTNKPERDTHLFDTTTDTILSDNQHKKKIKHYFSSTKKVTRIAFIFSDTKKMKETALPESEHSKKEKHHKKSTTSDKKDSVESGSKKQENHHVSHAGNINDIGLSDPESKKDISLSDTEHMKLLKNHAPSTQKPLRDRYASSETERKKDNSLSENEHKELKEYHVLSTKKSLRDRSDTGSEVVDDFSYIENRERGISHEMKTSQMQRGKSEDKKAERHGNNYGRYHTNGIREGGKKRKPNHYKHGTETTTHESKKTTKADLGNKFKAYTIKAHLNALKCKFNLVNITVEVIGRTISYNDIVMMKASEKRHSYDDVYFRGHENKFADDGPEKRIIFIVHGLSVMGIHDLPCLLEVKEFEKLLSYYFAHLDKFDIFLIPMANPDGVAVPTTNSRSYTRYSWVDWNKNMSPQSECPGVALDRNFDVAWNMRRNLSSCNQQYPGPYAFSEEETKAIRDVLHRYSQRIGAYINVHAGTYSSKIFKGDAVLYPKGFTDVQSEDDRYIDLRGEIDEALKNASFQVYTVNVDTLYNWYGKVSGTSVDYASHVYGIPYAMELVMQLYDSKHRSNEEEEEQHAVLRTSWRRVIDVIFNSIHRHLDTTG